MFPSSYARDIRYQRAAPRLFVSAELSSKMIPIYRKKKSRNFEKVKQIAFAIWKLKVGQ